MACPSLSARPCCLAASRSNVRQLDPRTPMMPWSPQFAPSHGSVGCRHLFPKFSLVLRLTPFALCAREVPPCSASLVSVLQCKNAGTHTISGVDDEFVAISSNGWVVSTPPFSVCVRLQNAVYLKRHKTPPPRVDQCSKLVTPQRVRFQNRTTLTFVSGLKLVVLWSMYLNFENRSVKREMPFCVV